MILTDRHKQNHSRQQGVYTDTHYETGLFSEVALDGTLTPIAEGLNYPYGIAEMSDGKLAVTINSAFGEAGSGEVIVLDPAGM